MAVFSGTGQADTITPDSISGGVTSSTGSFDYSGDDLVRGFGGNDTLEGDIGRDTLQGGDGNDVLLDVGGGVAEGGAGDDLVFASSDIVTSSLTGTRTAFRAESLSGGAGFDTLVLSGSRGSQAIADFTLLPGQGFLDPSDPATQISGFEQLLLPEFLTVVLDDAAMAGIVSISTLDDAAFARLEIKAGAANPVLAIAVANFDEFAIRGIGLANRRWDFSASTSNLLVETGMDGPANTSADTITMGGGVDTVRGGAGADALLGLGAGDEAFGGEGDDVLRVQGPSAAVLDGGDGTDVLEVAATADLTAATLTALETLRLAQGASVTLGAAQLDAFARISTAAAAGTASAAIVLSQGGLVEATVDRLAQLTVTGTAGAEDLRLATTARQASTRLLLDGAGGSDTLRGGLGQDTLKGGAAADTIFVGNLDRAEGGSGNDSFVVTQPLTIVGRTATVIDGGTGTDTLDVQGTNLGAATLLSLERLLLDAQRVSLTGTQLAVFGTLTGTGSGLLAVSSAVTDNLFVTGLTLLDILGSAEADSLAFPLASAAILLDAGGGADSIVGGSAADTLAGGDGNDTLFGEAGADSLAGGNGADLLRLGAADRGAGGEGDDTLEIALAPVAIDGGAGIDTLRLLASGLDLSSVTLGGLERLEVANDGAATRLAAAQLAGFQAVVGDPARIGRIELTAAGPAIALAAEGLSRLELLGTAQADALAILAGGTTPVRLTGQAGDDTLTGGSGGDTLDGGVGADSLGGGAGDDLVLAGAADTVLGGDGTDLVRLSGAPAQVDGGAGLGDELEASVALDLSATTLLGLEALKLLAGAPVTLTAAQLGQIGSVLGEGSLLLSAGGAATVTLGGVVAVTGSAGADTLTLFDGIGVGVSAAGGAGSDRITGDGGSDTLAGDDGNDTLQDRGGADQLDGGAGTDTLAYDLMLAPMLVDLELGTATGGGGQDTIAGFEAVLGGGGADTLLGDDLGNTVNGAAGNDLLLGADGADRLLGDAGLDTLQGGDGNDTMTGGAGADRFFVTAFTAVERITDFQDGIDVLEVSGFGAAYDTAAELVARAVQAGPDVRIVLPDFAGPAPSLTTIVLAGLTLAQLDVSDFALVSA